MRLPTPQSVTDLVLLGSAMVALMLALTLTADHGRRWLLLALAVVPLLTVWLRRRGSGPVRDLVTAPGMAGRLLGLLAEMTAVMAVLLLIPFHLQRIAAPPPAPHARSASHWGRPSRRPCGRFAATTSSECG